jgi:hypothetical protein
MALVQNVDFRDINGDGSPEVAYTKGGGGTGWTLSTITILSITDGAEAIRLDVRLPIEESTLVGAGDFDGDGNLEWAAIDASWELAGFCHACSPIASFVLDWDPDEQAFVDASPRFAGYLLRHIAPPQLPPTGASCFEQDAFLSRGVSAALSYLNVGYIEDASSVISIIESFEIDGVLRQKRDAIVRSLRTDPHHPSYLEGPNVDCPPE